MGVVQFRTEKKFWSFSVRSLVEPSGILTTGTKESSVELKSPYDQPQETTSLDHGHLTNLTSVEIFDSVLK